MITLLMTTAEAVMFVGALALFVYLILALRKFKKSAMISTPFQYQEMQRNIASDVKKFNEIGAGSMNESHMPMLNRIIDNILEVSLVKAGKRTSSSQYSPNSKSSTQAKISIAQRLTKSFESDEFSSMSEDALYNYVDSLTNKLSSSL